MASKAVRLENTKRSSRSSGSIPRPNTEGPEVTPRAQKWPRGDRSTRVRRRWNAGCNPRFCQAFLPNR